MRRASPIADGRRTPMDHAAPTPAEPAARRSVAVGRLVLAIAAVALVLAAAVGPLGPGSGESGRADRLLRDAGLAEGGAPDGGLPLALLAGVLLAAVALLLVVRRWRRSAHLLAAALATAALAVLAVPALGDGDAGGAGPAVVVVQARDVTAPAMREGLDALAATAAHTPGLGAPLATDLSDDGTVARVTVPLSGEAALATLRTGVVPWTVGTAESDDAAVTGPTAVAVDRRATSAERTAVVVALGVGVLLLVGLSRVRPVGSRP
jgi:hypothetical protein